MAALMKRERGAWNVTFPASTRRRGSSSSPSYHTWRLLLASNSRWLSKSTFRWRRCPTTPPERIEYWGLGLIVGKPAEQPDRACCRSIALQWRLRNWSALSSKRTFSCMPTSANVPWMPGAAPGAAAGTTAGGVGSAGGGGGGGAGGAGGGARRPGGRRPPRP